MADDKNRNYREHIQVAGGRELNSGPLDWKSSAIPKEEQKGWYFPRSYLCFALYYFSFKKKKTREYLKSIICPK